MAKDQKTNELSENEKAHKIEMLRQMMLNAEKTMQSAKAMLLQIEGKKKTGRKKKIEEETEGNVIEGTFDGQIMVGIDGKQYPVPANYASKSKLVEGDVLKLTITPDGSFIYKQIGPAQRKSVIGIVSQDEKGNYFILSEGQPYKVLLASITYFKAQPGDEVVIMVPREIDSSWAAIENVIQKGGHGFSVPKKEKKTKISTSTYGDSPQFDEMPHRVEAGDHSSTRGWSTDGKFSSWKKDLSDEESPENKLDSNKEAIANEWTSDIEELEKEIATQA